MIEIFINQFDTYASSVSKKRLNIICKVQSKQIYIDIHNINWNNNW